MEVPFVGPSVELGAKKAKPEPDGAPRDAVTVTVAVGVPEPELLTWFNLLADQLKYEHEYSLLIASRAQ